ncbi:hypothetical protein QQZ08_008238 [Neonectria magnoliae]|uniref:Uncharacterized protein n=1 Tax=Neonectria magnoliae TaxID=2732573 RepID=A0ABR1HXK8_9HYPO
MDPHDGSHPSQSIPDAAYPDDSPYQPGGSRPDLGVNSSVGGTSPVSSHQQQQHHQDRYSPSHLHTTPAYSPHPSPAAPSSWAAVPEPQAIPSGPPPPYDPTQPPSAYSPLDTASPARPAAAAVMPTPPGSSHYAPPSPYSAHPPSPNPYGSAGSSLENGSHSKLGPVAEARLRKRRKQKICIFAMCAVLLFLVALIVGVALGVLKVQFKGNDDDDDDRGPDSIQD